MEQKNLIEDFIISDAEYAEALQLSDAEYAQVLQFSEISNAEYAEKLQALQVSVEKLQLGGEIPVEFIAILDADLAENMQLLEAVAVSLSTTDPKPVDTGAESSRRFCDICYDNKSPNEMFKIQGCSHSFCSDCVIESVKKKIKENIAAITCLGENCRILVEPESVRSILPENFMERWEQILAESAIPDREKFYCPFKDCSYMMKNEYNKSGEIPREAECHECHRLFCGRCRVPWHQGIECEEFQKLDVNERGREDLMVRELAKDYKWMKCPHCSFLVEKTEGCIHMTCRCKFEFCYVCGSSWTKDHWSCQTK